MPCGLFGQIRRATRRRLAAHRLVPGAVSNMDASRTKNVNVALLGVAFMLVFTAFQTMGNVQTTILASASNNASAGYVPGFHASGYTSLAVIYAVFASANWLAPSVVSLLGLRVTMIVGGIFYALFIAQFLYPNDILMYCASAFLGFGAAILWTAQGSFLTINSDSMTMARNSGVFWAMLQSSLLIGNTFVYFQFKGIEDISEHIRFVLVIVLLSISASGLLVMFGFRPTPWNEADPLRQPDTPAQAFKKSWRLLWTNDMLLLLFMFFYSGLELTFWSGVYGTSVGNTQDFGTSAKSLVGLHGISVGVGEILGGLLFGIFGKMMVSRGRDPIIILGFLVHVAAFFLIFLNIPDSAPLGDTAEHAYISSSPYLAILCSFLLGFGDACVNTQVYSLLGSTYSDNSAAAFAIFKFAQSLASAVAFFYSNHVTLYYQLLALTIFCFLGTFCFVRVELRQHSAGIASRRLAAGDDDDDDGSCGIVVHSDSPEQME